MALRCGIIGLPNVGKSTLFNALSNAGAEAENYPFCTIEPNVGVVPVPDERLHRIAEVTGSSKATATTIEFVDIAGLVAGASKGEGLGNQFLAHIREVDTIVHVVRCFEDPNVVHVSGSVDPARDIEIIETELLLKDLDSVERRIDAAARQAKGGDKKVRPELTFYERLQEHLAEGKPVRSLPIAPNEASWLNSLFLLSSKPVLYAANVAEEELPDGGERVDVVRGLADREGARVVVVCADLEAQLSVLDPRDREAYLDEVGLRASGLERLVRTAYDLLGLITFFTTNSKETRAWTVRRGTKAPQAAGVVHTDFERGFIRAETVAYEDLAEHGSEAGVRSAGVLRAEGRDYAVSDGDVILFRFSG